MHRALLKLVRFSWRFASGREDFTTRCPSDVCIVKARTLAPELVAALKRLRLGGIVPRLPERIAHRREGQHAPRRTPAPPARRWELERYREAMGRFGQGDRGDRVRCVRVLGRRSMGRGQTHLLATQRGDRGREAEAMRASSEVVGYPAGAVGHSARTAARSAAMARA